MAQHFRCKKGDCVHCCGPPFRPCLAAIRASSVISRFRGRYRAFQMKEKNSDGVGRPVVSNGIMAPHCTKTRSPARFVGVCNSYSWFARQRCQRSNFLHVTRHGTGGREGEEMRAARFFICRQSHFGAQRPRAARPRRRFANEGNGTKALNVRESNADERAETEWKAPPTRSSVR